MMRKVLDKYFGEAKYMDWDEYERRINFLDSYYWQQSMRKTNL